MFWSLRDQNNSAVRRSLLIRARDQGILPTGLLRTILIVHRSFSKGLSLRAPQHPFSERMLTRSSPLRARAAHCLLAFVCFAHS